MSEPIRYCLVDPTGNITLLVETPVPVEQQSSVAARLMALEPRAEQAGFLSRDCDDSICLRMAGGEFCGNAAMSAAFIHALRAQVRCADVTVRVLGAEVSVSAHVEADTGDAWRGTVTMPEPLDIRALDLPGGGVLPTVTFPGIVHVITPRALERAEELAPAWCAFFGAEALGIMHYDSAEGRLTPLVYVPSAGTLFWESSCASGTAAVGYWLRHTRGAPVRLALSEPGGELSVAAEASGPLRLGGTLRLLDRRETTLSL